MFDVPIVRKYQCLCGFQAEIIETTTFSFEDFKYSSETTLEFKHDEPIQTGCVEIIQAFKEERKRMLELHLNGMLETLRRSLDLHG